MKKLLNKILSLFFAPAQGKESGYSLAELSISTGVIAVLAVGGLSILQKKNDAAHLQTTLTNIETIEKAMKGFIRTEGYIPCPAQASLLESNASFGKSEAYNTTTHKCDNNITNETGSVPVRTLGLTDDYSYDGWGRKFTYRSASGSGNKTDYENPNFRGNIAIVDLKGTHKTNINEPPPYNEGAIYVIISHGANGKGVAYSKNNATAPSEAAGIEKKNTQHNRPIYVQNEKTSKFDDIVSYGTSAKLGRQKVTESPIRIPNLSCENARAIVNAGRTDANLAAYAATNSNAYSSRADTIYKSATIISNLCENRERGESVNPLQFKGLSLWLDANDASTLFTNSDCVNGSFPANSAGIACWKDKSGNRNDAKQINSANQPDYTINSMNGKPTLVFNGSSDTLVAANSMSLSITGDMTIMAVINPTDFSVYNSIISKTAPNSFPAPYDYYTLLTTGIPSFLRGNSSVYAGSNSTTAVTASANNIVAVAMSGTTVSHYLNGASVGGGQLSTTIGDTNQSLYVGGRADNYTHMKGKMAEILLYSSALSNTDRQKLEEYLSDKWGIALSTSTSTCPAGLVFQKTATNPAGDCICPDGKEMRKDLSTANACFATPLNTNYGLCETKSSAPVYTSPAAPDKGGMVLWLDANDCTTVSLAPISPTHTTATVDKWSDKSGHGYDATQTTLTNQPAYITGAINSKPVLRFDGINDLLSISSAALASIANDVTIFIVSNKASNQNNSILFASPDDSTTNRFNIHLPWSDGNVYWDFGDSSSTGRLAHSWNASFATPYIWSFDNSSSPAGAHIWLNGTNIASKGSSGTPDYTAKAYTLLVGTAGYNGDIAEVIIYNKVLTNYERKAVEDYLSNKYDIIRYPNHSANTDLSGSLKIWMDAADTSTVYKDSSCVVTASTWDKVGCWRDKSGNNNNATQSTSSAQPVYAIGSKNGMPVIRFNGQHSLRATTTGFPTGSAARTVFWITERDEISSWRNDWAYGTAPAATGFSMGNYGGNLHLDSSYVGWMQLANPIAANTFYVMDVVYNAGTNFSTLKWYINGVDQALNNMSANHLLNTGAGSTFIIGESQIGGNLLIGSSVEIMVYNDSLNDTKRKAIERYLGNKWGVTIQ